MPRDYESTLVDGDTLHEVVAEYESNPSEENYEKVKRYSPRTEREETFKIESLYQIELQRAKEKFHPYANIWPLMNQDDLLELASDIKKARGLRFPIVLSKGLIVDGRNRYVACKMVNIKPEFVALDPDIDPFDFVKSSNKRRDMSRHSSAEKCESALKLLKEEEKRAKQRMLNGKKIESDPTPQEGEGVIEKKGESMKIAARHFHVSHDTLRRSKKIVEVAENDPEIARKWELAKKGKMTISTIYDEITNEPPKQEKQESEKEKIPEKNTARNPSKTPDMETIRDVIEYLASLTKIDPYLPPIARMLKERFDFVVKRNETLSGVSPESSKRESTKKEVQGGKNAGT